MIPPKQPRLLATCNHCKRQELVQGTVEDFLKTLGNGWAMVQLDHDGGDSVRILLACPNCVPELRKMREFLCVEKNTHLNFLKMYVKVCE